MMKRNAVIKADDGDGHKLEITIQCTSKNGLTRDEVDTIVRLQARLTARTLRELPYTDFGEENTQVRI